MAVFGHTSNMKDRNLCIVSFSFVVLVFVIKMFNVTSLVPRILFRL